MTLDDVMSQLQQMGTEQNRKVSRRHGAGEHQFGVSIANVRKLARTIGRDQALAEQLWTTGNQDARTLATLVADPKSMSPADLDRWARDLDYYVVTDMFSNIVAASPSAAEKAEQWSGSRQEYIGQAGWNLVAVLAIRDRTRPDEYFEAWLDRIERRIHTAMNRPRHAMNSALIAIGLRNDRLRARAEAVAARIGKVEVDHGQTGCITPDAAGYIAKAWTRKRTA